MSFKANYSATAETLCTRITALIPDHPEILKSSFDAWALFGIDGFECGDLEPTFMQASCALAKARSIHNAHL